MKKLGVRAVIYGIIGVSILYMAINQYLIKGDDLTDYGTKTTAKVISERIEEREMDASLRTGPTRYKVSIPSIQYVVNDDTMVTEVEHWASSIEGHVSSTNPLLKTGDQFMITVHPDQPDYFVRDGEGDYTNWAGYIIWGGIGLLFLFLFFRNQY